MCFPPLVTLCCPECLGCGELVPKAESTSGLGCWTRQHANTRPRTHWGDAHQRPKAASHVTNLFCKAVNREWFAKWQGIFDSFWFLKPCFDIYFCKRSELINYFILFTYVDSFSWVRLLLVPVEYLWLGVVLKGWFGGYLATYRFVGTGGLCLPREINKWLSPSQSAPVGSHPTAEWPCICSPVAAGHRATY